MKIWTKWLSRIAAGGGIAALLASGYYFSCPTIHVTRDTPLWGTKWDAVRQNSTHRGEEVGQLKTGDRLRILWRARGKDYIADFVLAPDSQTGWVLAHGQRGIEPP